MNRPDKLLAGWTFRAVTPTFEPGEVITACVSKRDGDELIVRIDGLIIRVEDGEGVAVEDKVRLEIMSLDVNNHIGIGDVVRVLRSDV